MQGSAYCCVFSLFFIWLIRLKTLLQGVGVQSEKLKCFFSFYSNRNSPLNSWGSLLKSSHKHAVGYFLLGMFSFGLQVGLERFLCCIIEPGGKKYGLRLTAVAYSRIRSAGYKVLERIANKMRTKAQPTDGPDDSFL